MWCSSTSPATDRSCTTSTSDSATRSCARFWVGRTHWQAGGDETPLPVPVPEFFFAPDEIARRGRELAQRHAEAWRAFAPVLERTLQIETITSRDELIRVYRDLVTGSADPARGYVVSLSA